MVNIANYEHFFATTAGTRLPDLSARRGLRKCPRGDKALKPDGKSPALALQTCALSRILHES